ncbi:LuxR family transcriptional regulator [Tabrizicola sp.]|uniref:helix-turn-helix transcriptional regulator n=1 Tax=Tabrizicola sp. TaxID=2005166 RepID=UPI00273282E4|nr:LuxR family transcriptional regulator [Tabrizicola sp.]MDP3193750.1 LuxR C-terminal-related transcriptional regulator [Tabrizicola sp.]
MRRAAPFIAIFVIQALCAFFFVSDILSSFFGFQTAPISWEMRELLEIGAAVGLILGVVLGGFMLRRALRDRHTAEEQLRRASGAFMDLLQERFAEWGLTPSEKDVALFAIKGMSTAEIATLRATSEGTVKAQTNAIYRKAGVSGRSQLLSLFIEDLMRDDGAVRPMPAPPASAMISAK